MPETTEQLKKWGGEFGKEYTDRNPNSLEELEALYQKNYGVTKTELNSLFLSDLPRSMRILEVGSNIGTQLLCLQKMGFKNLYGIEPQSYAVELSKSKTKNINIIKGDGFDIPFKDKYFDLVFTSGVLIHIHPSNILQIIKEIYRCTKSYIWGFEYYADEHTEIIYRGQKNLLWKANFSKIFLEQFDDLELIKEKHLPYLDNEQNVDAMFLLKKKDMQSE
ncbi:MAG: pseudaminic acid biosynthesis-associated methylase [bacterium]